LRTIKIHDSRSGKVTPLVPRDPDKVAIYACGPTVYDRIHVGNARPFVVFSIFKRFLLHEGYQTTFVANVTDVNDKIYDAATAQGIPSADLARRMTSAYVQDTDGLGLGRPDYEPKATETIPGIVDLISLLIDRGHAYAVNGDVYFAVRTYPRYGELSHRNPDAMDQGEGVEGADRKRDPLDFALWKAQKEGEDTAWDAPWGRGRPGWHIECSAMAEGLLGLNFEVHGGGNDLIFPHHENEAAQTAAAHEEDLARIWMHNGMVQQDAEKMSKSVGNIFSLHRALEVYGRDTLVLYLLSAHYRGPMAFGEEELNGARGAVGRIREVRRRLVEGPSPPELAPLKERFFDLLADDFHTERALAVVFEWVREANRRSEPVGSDDLREMLDVLALANLLDPDQGPKPDARALELLAKREEARAARDFATADRLRDKLRALGWEVRDGPSGPELLPIEPSR
jgi:cysteinyl-tRNA synthetase